MNTAQERVLRIKYGAKTRGLFGATIAAGGLIMQEAASAPGNAADKAVCESIFGADCGYKIYSA